MTLRRGPEVSFAVVVDAGGDGSANAESVWSAMRLGFYGPRVSYRATHKCPWTGIYEMGSSVATDKYFHLNPARAALADPAVAAPQLWRGKFQEAKQDLALRPTNKGKIEDFSRKHDLDLH